MNLRSGGRQNVRPQPDLNSRSTGEARRAGREATESLPVPFKGEQLEIGFNPEFLREGLESTEADELTLKLISPLRPGLIDASGDGPGSFLYLVMPIRLNV